MAFDTIESPSGRADQVLGGSVNYFSIAASFYANPQIVAVVGKDFPKDHLEWLRGRGVDTSGIEISDGKTFHWTGSYLKDLNSAETLATELNVFEAFKPRLNDGHVQVPYVFLANIQPDLQQDVLKQCKNPKLVAMDTMNLWINIAKESLEKAISKVDILCINDGEARMLSREGSLRRAARKILSMGPQVLVIKRGEVGASLFTADSPDPFLMTTYPVDEVVDPTGAGDSFAGAFVGTLAANDIDRDQLLNKPQLLKQAVVNGCVMASFTVEDFSIHRLREVTESDLKARRESLLQMIKF